MTDRGRLPSILHGIGVGKLERGAQRHYNGSNYGNGVSFRALVIGVTVFVVIVALFFWLFT